MGQKTVGSVGLGDLVWTAGGATAHGRFGSRGRKTRSKAGFRWFSHKAAGGATAHLRTDKKAQRREALG
jgi:hypothetical protein